MRRGRQGTAISPAKKLLFSLVAAAIVVLAAEGMGWLALHVDKGGGRSEEGREERLVFPLSREVVHPFLGFVQDPGVTEILTARGRRVRRRVSRDGFIDPGAMEAGPGTTGTTLVYVVGGSVALNLLQRRGPEMAEALASSAALEGRRVVLRNFAMGGYKQPQQLLTVAWLLSLGHRPDVVVNVDGYNEIVIGYQDDLAQGVFPFYPRSWRWRVRQLATPATELEVARLARMRRQRQALAEVMGSAAARSALVRFLAQRLDALLRDELSRIEADLRSLAPATEASFLASGPSMPPLTVDQFLDETARVWASSSLALDALCDGLGITYLHFLQPNQYDTGMKPIGEREREIAIAERSEVASLVPRGYPLLSQAGEELRSQGVSFHDLRPIFRAIEEPLYVDTCCHLGARGNEILAAEIVGRIRGRLEGRS